MLIYLSQLDSGKKKMMGLSVKLNLCLTISCLLTIGYTAPELRGIRAEGNQLVNYRNEEINIKVRRTQN